MPERSFSNRFDFETRVGSEPWSKAYFGLNVLRGLIDGIDSYCDRRQPQWGSSRSIGPALLGSSPWITDKELLGKLEGLAGACVVMTKQDWAPRKQMRKRLHELNERLPGLPQETFPRLSGLAPKVEGRPAVLGPHSPNPEGAVPTFRTLGFRKQGERLVPLLHTKLALLGRLWWHDEGPLGDVDDVVGFTPHRLWVSSANFTASSRRSLEFGYWTEEPTLLEAAEAFLVALMASSEEVDPDPDYPDPTLAPVEFDDEAFAEYLARWGPWDQDDLENG